MKRSLRQIAVLLPSIVSPSKSISQMLRLRLIRQLLPVIIAFVLGVALTSLFCNNTATPVEQVLATNVDKLPKLENIVRSDSSASPEVTQEENEVPDDINQPIPTEKPPTPIATKEPYPPLIAKKGLIITPKYCPDDLFLLIIVVTSSRNFEARKSIRSSWGKADTSKQNETASESVRVIYVVGSDEKSDSRVTKEAKRFRDILRGNFEDVYRQNEFHSVKMLLGFKWSTSSCKAKFILKASSESFVNVPEIMSWLKNKNDAGSDVEGLYTGFCHGHDIAGVNVIRNKDSPWYVSEEEWAEKRLPPYASGMGIALSYDVVEKMVELSVEEMTIHIEDVYLGILAKKLSVHCKDESSRFDTSYSTMLTECEDRKFCVLGGVPTKDMYYLMQNVMNLKDIC